VLFLPEAKIRNNNGEMSAMSWLKITLPLSAAIDPAVVEIGNLAKACYEREKQPEGFAMFHATRAGVDEADDTRLVYLSPIAADLCGEEIGEKYTLEPCDVPARDEPNMAFVFGDPRVMGHLADRYEPSPQELLRPQYANPNA
jgi:hypothetical protein